MTVAHWRGQKRLQRQKQRIVGFNQPYAEWLKVRSGQDAKVKRLDTISDCLTQQAVRETTRGETALDFIRSKTQDPFQSDII